MRIFAFVFVFAALFGAASAKDKIVMGTNWTAQAEHGGFYYAKAYGLYDAAGLDVEIRPGGAQVNTAQLLVGGKLDFAILSNSSILLNMVREEVPYLAVAGIFQKDPQVLMAHASQNFADLKDLKGRPIFISTDARETFWQFLRVRYGFADEQIRPYTYSITPFLAERSAIQQGYLSNEPFRAKEAGIEPKVFLLADYGYSSYAAILTTSRALAEGKPDLVQRFVDASIKGWVAYLSGERAKADALIVADNPEYSTDKADQAVGVMRSYAIATGGDAGALGLGAMSEARWKDFFETMVQAGVYDSNLDWKRAFTPRFVNKKVGMN